MITAGLAFSELTRPPRNPAPPPARLRHPPRPSHFQDARGNAVDAPAEGDGDLAVGHVRALFEHVEDGALACSEGGADFGACSRASYRVRISIYDMHDGSPEDAITWTDEPSYSGSEEIAAQAVQNAAAFHRESNS